ncbi:MAG: UDP-N-acetylglucosamine 1-carboxyvinyltransferase [Planctomycetota bacterium]|jgi:UDP-N-acetylglucosamine 1-carboxyvinyltransferase
MDAILVEGGNPLRGEVPVSGAKNAALPILAATLLVDGEVRLEGLPELRDIKTMLRLLAELGSAVEHNADGSLSLAVEDATRVEAPYKIVKEMRASFCVLGPLLAGLKALGARLMIDGGYVRAEGGLRGDEVFLAGPYGSTVLGTANVMMAACLAEGRTVIEGAACEPEIADLAHFLVACGARIDGIGSHRLVVDGVERLTGTSWRIIPDRMEAGTFMAAVTLAGGDVMLGGADAAHMGAVVEAVRALGAGVERSPDGIRVTQEARPRPLDLTTLPYPGFPTDLQAPFTAALTVADGMSVVTEKIYPERFMHVAELNRMGASIRKQGPSSIVHGVPGLSGAEVMASDIRGGASLVVAGLGARGTTKIHRVYHVDRGYDRIEEKFAGLGARIRRTTEG